MNTVLKIIAMILLIHLIVGAAWGLAYFYRIHPIMAIESIVILVVTFGVALDIGKRV